MYAKQQGTSHGYIAHIHAGMLVLACIHITANQTAQLLPRTPANLPVVQTAHYTVLVLC